MARKFVSKKDRGQKKGAAEGKTAGSRGGKGHRKQTSMAQLLKDTLIPKSRAAAHMAARAQQVKDREKLHADEFKEVKSSVMCQGVWLFILAGIWTGASFYLIIEAQFDNSIFLAMAGVGALSLLANMLGIMGAKFESDRLLLTYMSFQTCIVLSTIFFSTFCMILTEKTVRTLEIRVGNGSYNGTISPEILRIFMYSIGGCALLQVPMQGYAVKNTGRLLTTMRAVSNFMETLTILMFPVGCVFIAAGVYIVNSIQNDPTSAITALFIFAIGCFIIMLSALGYFGTMIHSRGMLLMFQWPVLLMVIVLIGIGAWSTVQAEVVKSQLDTYWEDIRRFMPQTFEGRYDRALFAEFIDSNLMMIAFGCFYTGGFFLFCAFGAGLMRQEIKVEHLTLREAEKREMLSMERMEFEAERVNEVRRLEQDAGVNHAEAEHIAEEHMRHKLAHGEEWINKHKNQFHKRWKAAWTKGSKASRCAVRVACSGVCLVLIVVVACGLAFLVYASFCEGLQADCVTTETTTKVVDPTNVTIVSDYNRGTISVLPADKVSVKLQTCSIQGDYKQGTLVTTEDTSSVLYKLSMVANPPRYFGVDTSCQKVNMEVGLPKSLSPDLDVSTESVVAIDSDDLSLRSIQIKGENAGASIKKLTAVYDLSNIDATNADSHDAVLIDSLIGEAKISGSSCSFSSSDDNVRGKMDPNLYVHGEAAQSTCSNKVTCKYTSTVYPVPAVSTKTGNGFVTLEDMHLVNCDLNMVSTDSGPSIIRNVVVKCQSKYCGQNNRIDVTAERGSVEMKSVIADAFAVRTAEGRVKLESVTQLNPETGITVTTGRGKVEIFDLVAAGNIQLETSEGDITLTIPMCGKYPAYFGSFQIAYSVALQKEGNDIFAPTGNTVKRSVYGLMDADRKAKAFVVIDDSGASGGESGQITGTIGCHMPTTGSTCAYSNELLISTESGRVTVSIDQQRDVCPSASSSGGTGTVTSNKRMLGSIHT